jgi:hypothetical protein
MAFKKVLDTASAKETIRLGGEGNPSSVEGYFLGTRKVETEYGEAQLHAFQTKKGVIAVWGKTIMNNLLAQVPVGEMTRVTFTGMGEKKKGRNPAYLYNVEHDESEKIDTGSIDLVSATSTDEEEDYGTTESEDEVPSAPAPSSQSKIQALLNSRRKVA